MSAGRAESIKERGRSHQGTQGCWCVRLKSTLLLILTRRKRRAQPSTTGFRAKQGAVDRRENQTVTLGQTGIEEGGGGQGSGLAVGEVRGKDRFLSALDY